MIIGKEKKEEKYRKLPKKMKKKIGKCQKKIIEKKSENYFF